MTSTISNTIDEDDARLTNGLLYGQLYQQSRIHRPSSRYENQKGARGHAEAVDSAEAELGCRSHVPEHCDSVAEVEILKERETVTVQLRSESAKSLTHFKIHLSIGNPCKYRISKRLPAYCSLYISCPGFNVLCYISSLCSSQYAKRAPKNVHLTRLEVFFALPYAMHLRKVCLPRYIVCLLTYKWISTFLLESLNALAMLLSFPKALQQNVVPA